MVRTTIWFGSILTAFGLVAYLMTGGNSSTALIPALLGIPIALLGIAARDERWRPGALRIAIGIGVLGLLGTISGLTGVASTLLLNGKASPPLSLLLQALMAIGCATFVAIAIRGLVSERRVMR